MIIYVELPSGIIRHDKALINDRRLLWINKKSEKMRGEERSQTNDQWTPPTVRRYLLGLEEFEKKLNTY